MKLWIGHFQSEPRAWFVAWGDTKLEAAAHVAEEWREPDLRSMRPVEGPGAIAFHVDVEHDGEGPYPMLLASPEGEPLDASLGLGAGVEENEAWVVRLARQPLPRAAAPPVAELHAQQREPLVQALIGNGSVVADCGCDVDADVLNDPCGQFVDAPAAPERCLVCEHLASCHPRVGVRP